MDRQVLRQGDLSARARWCPGPPDGRRLWRSCPGGHGRPPAAGAGLAGCGRSLSANREEGRVGPRFHLIEAQPGEDEADCHLALAFAGAVIGAGGEFDHGVEARDRHVVAQGCACIGSIRASGQRAGPPAWAHPVVVAEGGDMLRSAAPAARVTAYLSLAAAHRRVAEKGRRGASCWRRVFRRMPPVTRARNHRGGDEAPSQLLSRSGSGYDAGRPPNIAGAILGPAVPAAAGSSRQSTAGRSLSMFEGDSGSASGATVVAMVKWYDPVKGFGFLASAEGERAPSRFPATPTYTRVPHCK